MRPVCQALGVTRSHVMSKLKRPESWQDRRKGRRPADDALLVQELRGVVVELQSYGYRRACELVNREREATGADRVTPSVPIG